MSDLSGIWLEVSNARFNQGGSGWIEVQLKGDKADKDQEWWPIHLHGAKKSSPKESDVKKPAGEDSDERESEENKKIQQAIFSGLDKKRVVLAKLEPDIAKNELHCTQIRIQHAEPGSR